MIYGGKHSFRFASMARIIGDSENLQAWAEHYVRRDRDIKWVIGNFVEANRQNSNGHYFPVQYLPAAARTLEHKPLNMLHYDQYVVGSFAGAQLLLGDEELSDEKAIAMGEAAESSTGSIEDAEDKYPHMEALAAFWHSRFPDEYAEMKRAHADGKLFYSMEAVPVDVQCPTCDHRVAFAGLESETYCDHMQGGTGPKILHEPVFNGGAIIIPPARPGWNGADVKTMSKLIEDHENELDQMYVSAQNLAPHLDPRDWEFMMTELIRLADS